MLRFFLFVASVMAAGTTTAGGIARCSVDMLPIQIVDERRQSSMTILSAAEISAAPPDFRAFVTTVTEHIAVRLATEKLCMDSTNSKKRSLLQFVNWPLATSGNDPLAPVPSLDGRTSGSCRISSPWIDLVFERKPIPWIRGVARWNQRQLLIDQASLAGARNMHPGLAMPLKQSEFNRFSEEYVKTEILGEPAVEPIEARVPPDLLWLFRRAWQTTRGPFSGGARNSMNIAMKKGAESYTQLVIALIDRCFASKETDIRYNSIFDVADLITIEQYTIDTPIR